ncbi:MAG: hypothetical protein WD830_04285 [Chloroflexota bacterium]
MSASRTVLADDESGVDELRSAYRPRRVKTLFVGESSPAQGTHFYRANSNLFRATHAAFAEALGNDAVPMGEVFLRLFATKGCWLVDLADRPVNQLDARERRQAVEEGVPRLAELIGETRPKQVVVIKRDIAGAVEQAIALAGVKKPAVLLLRYPLRQYRAEFVRELAAFVRDL